jgi:cytochrome b involved in lipid metabolism
MNFYKEDPEINQVVIFEGVVYNVKEYKNLHPGGTTYLEENFGKHIDELFIEYEHTMSAKSIFRDLPLVGICLEGVSTDDNNSDDHDDKFTFDYS